MVRELARVRSEYQDILIFQSASHGRVLVLDGAVQITEADEFVYQEMLAHVPLLAHGNARRVHIIGAGDGGVLRRVLAHNTVEQAVLVEVDGEVIRLARSHMPGVAGAAWDDSRADVRIGDGLKFVAESQPASFDAIIVDSTDPVGVGETLFTEAFYADCARALGPDGVVVNQSGVPFMQGQELRDTSRRRASAFAHVTAYVAAVPTYVGGFMALGFSAKRPGLDALSVPELRDRAATAGILGQTRYWSPEVQAAAFQLPPYIRDLLPG